MPSIDCDFTIVDYYMINQIIVNYYKNREFLRHEMYSKQHYEIVNYKKYSSIFYMDELSKLGISLDNFLEAVRLTQETVGNIDLHYNSDDNSFIIYFNNLKSFVDNFYKERKYTKKEKYVSYTYIYVMIDYNTNYYKIGRSNKPEIREKTLQSEKPTIELLGKWEAKVQTEKLLHNHFDNKRVRGEWFDLSAEDLKNIPNLIKELENE